MKHQDQLRATGFRQALRDHGLRAFMGDDASLQPGALQEVMLHETAVAWCRYKLARCLPARPWLETPEEYRTRLKAAVAGVEFFLVERYSKRQV